MFKRRKLPVGILLALVLTLSLTASVGAQEVPTEDLDGTARFRDASALSDSLVMSFTDVPALPAGFAYEGWLIDGTGDKVSVGVLSLDTEGNVDQTFPPPVGSPVQSDMNDRFAPDTAKGASGTALVTTVQRGTFAVDEVVVGGLAPDHAYDLVLVVTPKGSGLEDVLDPSKWITAEIVAGVSDSGGVVTFTDTQIPGLGAGAYRLDVLVTHDHPENALERDFLAACQPFFEITVLPGDLDNLIARYDRFAISVEPVPDPDPATPGPIFYSDSIPAGAFLHIGHLVVNWPSNPDGKGIATGLRENMTTARNHAVLAQNSSTLEAKTLHAHHVVNIIEGPGGPNYDISFGDPGDDFGVLNYAADAIVHAGLAKNAAPENTTVVDMADEVIEAANRTIDFATRARDNALLVIAATAATNETVLRLQIENMVEMTTRGLNGTDEDGDGDVGATGAEGGAKTVYTKSQDMGQFEPVAGAGAPSVGDGLVPVLALGALMAGLVLTTGGGLLLFRRRRTA